MPASPSEGQNSSEALLPLHPVPQPPASPGPLVNAGSASNQPAISGQVTGPEGLVGVAGWALPNGIAVYASSQNGWGVQATSNAGIGVQASSQSSTGVVATSNTGIGLQATSNTQDAVQGVSSAQPHAGVSGTNLGGGFGLWASSQAAGGTGIFAQGQANAAVFSGNISHSNGHVDFNGPVWVNDVLTAQVDIVLGSDCAENFDIAAADDITPGTVMVLNGDGALEPSQCPYDKKVAGVISGAGDYQPGLILGGRDSSESRMPLALAGKVFCNIDAEYGPVEVGDLLTTSPTRGHAMRAADASKAFGTVIGKALRPLNSGRALVPILIALQ